MNDENIPLLSRMSVHVVICLLKFSTRYIFNENSNVSLDGDNIGVKLCSLYARRENANNIFHDYTYVKCIRIRVRIPGTTRRWQSSSRPTALYITSQFINLW